MLAMKNCLKSLLTIAVTALLLSKSAGKDLGIFSVDPGTSGTRPHVGIKSNAGENWAAFYYKLNLGKPELRTSSTFSLTSETVTVEFPEVEADTFMEVALTTHPQPMDSDFRWRTLVRPEGKNVMAYRGQKEMLPPDDFDEYWTRAKKQLESVEPNTRVTRQPDRDTSTGLLYRVELDSVEDTTIVGWYYVPRAAFKNENPEEGIAQKYPAIIITPGYGAEEPPIDRTKLGYITFSTNPRNHGPSKAYWKSPVEHLLYNITEPESYYYKLAFLDCLRAAKFVLGREEVDADNVATEGGSQGGLFAVATAMLEPRVKCVAANVIAFTDYPDGMELASTGGQTQLREMIAEEGTTAALIRKSLAYTDGANMITRVKAPVQINMGGVDPVCPYICGVVAFNRLPKSVKKEFHVVPSAAHEVPGDMRKWNMEWFDRWLKSDKADSKAQN